MYLTAPPHQFDLANTATTKFGRDHRQQVLYKFNSLGWRSDIEYLPHERHWVFIGNSVTFGMGLDQSLRFSDMLAMDLGFRAYNFSIAHLIHSNMQYMRIIDSVLALAEPEHWVIQVNNLDRLELDGRWVHVTDHDTYAQQIQDQFWKFWRYINDRIPSDKLTLLYWDEIAWPWLPQEFLSRVGRPIPVVDSSCSEMSETFGVRTHRLIYTALRTKFQ